MLSPERGRHFPKVTQQSLDLNPTHTHTHTHLPQGCLEERLPKRERGGKARGPEGSICRHTRGAAAICGAVAGLGRLWVPGTGWEQKSSSRRPPVLCGSCPAPSGLRSTAPPVRAGRGPPEGGAIVPCTWARFSEGEAGGSLRRAHGGPSSESSLKTMPGETHADPLVNAWLLVLHPHRRHPGSEAPSLSASPLMPSAQPLQSSQNCGGKCSLPAEGPVVPCTPRFLSRPRLPPG